MPWDIEYTEQFETWWRDLNGDEQFGLAGVIQRLEAEGPALGRPHADRINQSRHHNIKEASRPNPASALRIRPETHRHPPRRR